MSSAGGCDERATVLRGSLEEFGLADIFRLLSATKKTGRLDVERVAGSGTVYFKDGDVDFAESTLTREPLGQKLIRTGVLTERELTAALDEHAHTGKRVGEVLVEHGAIEQGQLEDAIKSQVQDATFELLRWDMGEFAFEAVSDAVAEVPVALSVDQILMEASRRLEELETIARRIPSGESVLRVAPSPPEGAHQISITPEEWRLLVMIDGRRTVGDIAAAAKVDEFTAMRILYGLAEAGLVEVVSQDIALEIRAVLESQTASSDAGAPAPDAVADPDPAAPSEAAVAVASEDGAPEIDGATEGDGDAEAEPVPEEEPVAEAEPAPEEEPVAEAGPAPEEEPVAEAEPAPEEEPVAETEPVAEAEPAAEAEPVAGAASFAPDPPAAPEPHAPDPLVAADDESARVDAVSEVALELSDVAAASFSSDFEGPSASTEADPTTEGREPQSEDVDAYLGSFLDEVGTAPEGEAVEAVTHDSESGSQGAPRRPGRKIDRSRQPVPNLDRAAVVRELASLFGDDEALPTAASGASGDAAPSPRSEMPEPPRPKRVEDDDQLSKGLIHRLIDGVKGL